MLVLTRRVGERVVIGDDVQVTVLGVRGDQVQIGFNAPKSVPVHRQEIYEQIRQGRGTQHVTGNAQSATSVSVTSLAPK